MKTSDRKKEYNTKGKFTKTEKWILLLSISILVASLVFRAVTWNLNLKILHTTGSDVGVTVTLGFVGVMMYVIFFVAALFPATWRMTEKQKEKIDEDKYQNRYRKMMVGLNFTLSVIFALLVIIL